jgi:hypothetical protein
MVGKIIIWVILMFAIFGASTLVQEAYVPSKTSDAAVKQFDNSDESYTQLRERETTKNWIEVITWLAAALITLGLFFNNIKTLIKKAQEKKAQPVDNSHVKHVDNQEI